MSSLVSALKSRLANAADYERLVHSSSMSEIGDFFQAKYSSILSIREPRDEVRAQRIISSDYRMAVRKVRSLSPPGLRKVINAIAREAELEVVSSLLKGIDQDADPSDLAASIVPIGDYDEETIRQLAETRPLRRAVESLRDRELGEIMLHNLDETGIDSAPAIDLSTQTAFTRGLWRATKLFLAGPSAGEAKRILGQWFDLQNILLVARSKVLGVRSSIVQSFIIPVHYRLGSEDLDQLIASTSLSDVLEKIAVTKYGLALAGIAAGTAVDVSTLETRAHRFFAKQCALGFARWRFSPGPPIAFLFLKRFESEDLQAILTGKIRGLSSEDILRNIILHQESLS